MKMCFKTGDLPKSLEMVNPRKNPMDLREPNFEIDSYTTIHVDRNRLNFVQICDWKPQQNVQEKIAPVVMERAGQASEIVQVASDGSIDAHGLLV